ncbi:hypothetical protein RCG23_18235 [Neobacillus sp. PS3-34]|uniref:hypothetical protein n=1 Tax=Neobacillus sp. PS3-34 TaxID=3070678 RepID=UPI0027E10A63|nr:hypothetical protein [Neobacillus sp. PS3-34]WML47381.1 hypothetical protein RCG23_18235 [Neobacillus sp. PS3-34]
MKELDLKNEKIAQLRNELEKASDKMKDYQKNGNIKTAIAAQQSLLNFLSLYNSL